MTEVSFRIGTFGDRVLREKLPRSTRRMWFQLCVPSAPAPAIASRSGEAGGSVVKIFTELSNAVKCCKVMSNTVKICKAFEKKEKGGRPFYLYIYMLMGI